MKKNGKLDFSIVTRHPIIFLAMSLLAALPFWAFNPFVKTVNNVDYFKLEGDPDEAFYNEFKKIFGNDEFFVIAFDTEDLFSAQNLELVKRVTEDLKGIEEIKKVRSLTSVDDVVGGEEYFEVRPFIENIPKTPLELAELKKKAVSNPLYVRNLVSADGRTAAIVVEIFERPEDWDYRQRLLEKTQAVLDKYETQAGRFYMGGWTTVNLSLSQYLKKDITVFVPAVYLLITITVWLFFRSIPLTILAVANISACVGATRGFMGMAGITLNNVTVVVIPLTMALALCDTVHIFSHLDKKTLKERPDKGGALGYILNRVALPCFLTTLTTAVGFLSLAVSKIEPIRQFAWVASAGMVFEYFFSFFLLPPMILLFKPEQIYREYDKGAGVASFMEKLAGFIRKHNAWVLGGTAALTVVSIWLALGLKVETNLLEFFKKSAPVRTSLDFVEKKISGVSTLDIWFQGGGEDAFKDPANLKLIEQVQRHIDTIQGVDKTLSLVDFLKDMNESFHNEDRVFYRLPESREMVSQYLLIYDSDEIENVVSASYDHARISVRMSVHGSKGQKELVSKIKAFLPAMEHPGVEIRVTGRAVQDINTIEAIVNGQISSLAMAAAVISLIMFFVLRSVSVAFLSMLPNIFPIILNFGIMGATGIALDTGTALIAAVALGIAVDDTIHLLTGYQEGRRKGMTASEAMTASMKAKGRAVVSSSVILCIGFGVMVLSRFVPTMHFGLLSAVIMITALVGDVVLLPALIFRNKKFKVRSSKLRKGNNQKRSSK